MYQLKLAPSSIIKTVTSIGMFRNSNYATEKSTMDGLTIKTNDINITYVRH
jgi:hypothetical protein